MTEEPKRWKSDAMFHHQAVVGPAPTGFIRQWSGDAFVEGCFLPDAIQLQVVPGVHLRFRCKHPGRLVAFIEMQNGQSYLLPFVDEVEPATKEGTAHG